MNQKAEELKKSAAHYERLREESFERSDTDGFLTQWAMGICGRRDRLQAEIEENNGLSTFTGLYERASGKRVAAKLINGKFGLCWAFCDENGKFTGRFLGHSKGTKRSRLYKEGFELREEEAPAKAVIQGEGTGLSGQAWAAVVRTDGGYPNNAEVL